MRVILNLILVVSMIFYGAPALAVSIPAPSQPAAQPAIDELIQESFIELFELVPGLNITPEQAKAAEKRIKDERAQEEKRLKGQEDDLEGQIRQAQDSLKVLNRNSEQSTAAEGQRHELHCNIQKHREDLQEVKLALDKGLDNKFDNQLAKLKVLSQWPAKFRQIEQMKAQGTAAQRKFGDYQDVGFRGGVFEGQEEDVEDGREAVDEMRRMNIIPPEVEDEEIQAYVKALADKIARHSDLRVPLNVTVLRSEEINAFALPGGFLFVNSGLIAKARNESELAGVLAHEMAHVTARHGDRLMGKANIANIVFQAAQLAALIFTGGVASIGTYYALQYGFFGLGMVLSLTLLGVSRDYETEADILGAQYLWHTGYDPKGFISFFSTMAEEKGYVSGLSWFRTHPPFYERMEATYSEILFMPPLEDPVIDTEQFRNAKAVLERILEKMEDEDREAPTLRRVFHCDGEPGVLDR